MEEFGKKEILNPFLKWAGGILICPIAILAAVCGEWIWAFAIAGVGIVSILTGMSRAFGTSDDSAGLKRCIAAILTATAIISLYIDICMWCGAFVVLLVAIGLLTLSFYDNRNRI